MGIWIDVPFDNSTRFCFVLFCFFARFLFLAFLSLSSFSFKSQGFKSQRGESSLFSGVSFTIIYASGETIMVRR